MIMTLYNYFRSSASYRVRIALNLKELTYTNKEIHLANSEQHSENYQEINPQELVPSLQVGDYVITQSLAIIEYLEEQYPTPALLPFDVLERAQVRSLAQIIACDIHPLNNLRVLNYLKNNFHADDAAKKSWYHHWLKLGLDALENFVNRYSLTWQTCYKNELTLADVCLIPQLYNARRYEFSLENYPGLCQIEKYCLSLPAFEKAHPEYAK